LKDSQQVLERIKQVIQESSVKAIPINDSKSKNTTKNKKSRTVQQVNVQKEQYVEKSALSAEELEAQEVSLNNII
jgi:hypothetical protein